MSRYDPYENPSRDHAKTHVKALPYEEFEAAFAQSGTEYTSSQSSYQARDPYPTASPLSVDPRIHPLSEDPRIHPLSEDPRIHPLSENPRIHPLSEDPRIHTLSQDPRIHGWSYDSERSNDAGHSPYWSAAKHNCQEDLSRESDATQALSLSSRTNDLGRRQPDPRGRDNPSSQEYGSQITGPNPCSSCHEQASKSSSTSPSSASRSNITATLDSRAKSPSSYGSAVSVGASLLVGVVASGVGAEFAARAAIQSLRR